MEGSRPPSDGPQPLIAALTGFGLEVSSYETSGTCYVHVSPPHVPTAGTLIRILRQDGELRFLSEWGTIIGADAPSAARYILRWFGKVSPRP